MTLSVLLSDFYNRYKIPKDGGENDDTFKFKVFGKVFNLPNPNFRKKALYIHDLHHILNKCDITWKGEAFIAGWEISTGIWKHFPLGFLSSWAMGYSIWIYPKSVLKGFKKGLNNIGVIDLNIDKSDFMKMEFEELERLTTKNSIKEMYVLEWFTFLFWIIISQMIFLFPLIFVVTFVMLLS